MKIKSCTNQIKWENVLKKIIRPGLYLLIKVFRSDCSLEVKLQVTDGSAYQTSGGTVYDNEWFKIIECKEEINIKLEDSFFTEEGWEVTQVANIYKGYKDINQVWCQSYKLTYQVNIPNKDLIKIIHEYYNK